MRRLTLAVAFFLGLAGSAWADFEDGKAAYDRGDYATALEAWLPLAQQGHVRAQWQLGRLYQQNAQLPPVRSLSPEALPLSFLSNS